jgi:hypothetical protein
MPLYRRGRWYESHDIVDVPGGERLGLAPAVMVAADARATSDPGGAPPVLGRFERVRLLSAALDLFDSGTVDLGPYGLQSAAEFRDALRRTAGLPPVLTDRWIGMLRAELALAEAAASPATRRARALVSLPANTFTCLEAVFRAALDSEEVWIRPSRREPISALRMAGALLQAGWPPRRLGFYPTTAETLPALIEVCDRPIVFGGERLAERFPARPELEVHGPGRGLALVAAGVAPAVAAARLLPLIAADAGRFCTNVCTVLCEGDPEPLALELAGRLDAIGLDPVDERLPQTVVVDPPRAEAHAHAVLDRIDASARMLTRRPTLHRLHDEVFLAPSLVLLDGSGSAGHPLLAMEVPFPFASVSRTEPWITEAAESRSLFVYDVSEKEAA